MAGDTSNRSRRRGRALAFVTCGLSALALLSAAPAGADASSTGEEPRASATPTGGTTPADGFTEASDTHQHGSLTPELGSLAGDLFATYDSGGGYYGTNAIAAPRRPTGR